MNYLLVVAHPDDEVLGAGASIWNWTQKGHKVAACVLCANAGARACRPSDQVLHENMEKSMKMLGICQHYLGNFPNIEMNTVPHIELVQFVENAIMDFQPDVVLTHFPSDINNDHVHTSIACQAAVRVFQRRPEIKPVSELWFMEVNSSTDWSLTPDSVFVPNNFVEVHKEGVNAKIAALKNYTGVMRPYPHPRSVESIEGLAAFRGSQAGLDFAEAFQCVFRRQSI